MTPANIYASQTILDLAETLEQLTHETAYIDRNPDGLGYGVWVGDDIIGTGASESEAMEDAVRTARGWKP